MPIIAEAMKEDRAKWIEAGASVCLSKPMDRLRPLGVAGGWLYR